MKAPAFSSGNCMMVQYLSKPEVEYLGPHLVSRMRKLELELRFPGDDDHKQDLQQEIRTLQSILTKIDYPFRS